MNFRAVIIFSLVLGLSACAWASRNVYNEPTSGDIGLINIVNNTTIRSIVWISYEPDTPGKHKAISMYDDSANKSVKALHKEYVYLSLSLVDSGASNNSYYSNSCAQNYKIPFFEGNIKTEMDIENGQCTFKVYLSDKNGKWKDASEKVEVWPRPFRVEVLS